MIIYHPNLSSIMLAPRKEQECIWFSFRRWLQKSESRKARNVAFVVVA